MINPPSKLTPEGLALTHGTAFENKGWTAVEFKAYLNDPSALIFGSDASFAVVRLMAAEAEVLTLATRPSQQNRGRATAMLRGALAHLRNVGVKEVFLDVSDQNTAARALYARCGFTSFALRHNYYKNGTTAICMKAVL